jgi:hypothetical protein|tara:strand:+ start:1507 stop:1611 length:105 start_codon:yes stop_codon:yes gene_type:complete
MKAKKDPATKGKDEDSDKSEWSDDDKYDPKMTNE